MRPRIVCNVNPIPDLTFPAPLHHTSLQLFQRQACTSSHTKPPVAMRSLGLVASPLLYRVRSRSLSQFPISCFCSGFIRSCCAGNGDTKREKKEEKNNQNSSFVSTSS